MRVYCYLHTHTHVFLTVFPALQACALVQRSKSFCQTEIEKLLDSDTNNFALPTVAGKHQDLKYITPDMVSGARNTLVFFFQFVLPP